MGRGDTDALMTELNSLGLDRGWQPSTDVDAGHFKRMTGLLHGIADTTGQPQTVGLDSLRRAAITNDALTQGVQAGDLIGQNFLTDGLARAKGGSIPAHTRGALSGTCGCVG